MTAEQRDRIIGMLNGGCGTKEVSEQYGSTQRAVRDLYKRYHQTGASIDKPRSGRPSILSPN